MGNGNSAPPQSPVQSETCLDQPIYWVDSRGMSCTNYADYQWCTQDGDYGDGWDDDWGSFSNYADEDGVDASQACCLCGGGNEFGMGLSKNLRFPEGYTMQLDGQFEVTSGNEGCANGYFFQEGDVPGRGTIDGRGGFEVVSSNCDSCASLCDSAATCKSYECSPSTLRCNLNTVQSPTQGMHQDFLFCSKGAVSKLCTFTLLWAGNGGGGGQFTSLLSLHSHHNSTRITTPTPHLTPPHNAHMHHKPSHTSPQVPCQ